MPKSVECLTQQAVDICAYKKMETNVAYNDVHQYAPGFSFSYFYKGVWATGIDIYMARVGITGLEYDISF